MADDRTCDLGAGCRCALAGVDTANMWDACPHFHMPCPSIVQSKQQRLGTTRDAFEKRRDKIVRGIEHRKPNNATEDKLAEIRHSPRKRLARRK